MNSLPPLTHGTADLAPDVRLHYVSAGNGRSTVVLIHGYPENWWQWRHVIGPLADAGFRVIAVDSDPLLNPVLAVKSLAHSAA